MKKSVKFLCYIMFVTLFTFSLSCQNVKAYNSSGYVINGTGSGRNSEGTAILDWSITTGNGRGCFIYIDDTEDAQSLTGNIYCDSALIYVSNTSIDFNRGEPNQDIYIGWYGNAEYTPDVNTGLANKMSEYGFTNQVLANMSFKNITEPNNYSCSWTVSGSVDYVKNYHDLYEYLYNNNDSVIKRGDPTTSAPEEVINNHSLPVPQEVEVYKDSENPAVVWANPVISGDKTVYVEIDWLPTIDCINGRSVISTLKPDDYVRCCYEKLDGHNAFVTQQFETSRVSNDLMGYDYITDSKPLYSLNTNSWFSDLNTNSTLQFVETPLMYIIGEDKFNSFNIRGLKYRIRYVFGTENVGNWTAEEVSDWIYSDRRYGYDNKSPSPHSTTTRYTASGDPVDNTNYRPNTDPNIINVTSDGNSWWVKFNNDTLSVFNIFKNNINKEEASMNFEDSDSSVGRSDSIFKLVSGFFKEFPIFMVFLISGFAVVVFLRIFGR